MEELPEDGEVESTHVNVLKQKIGFVGKMSKMQKTLREEHETILKIKSMNNNKLPKGVLIGGKEALNKFVEIKNEDLKNESRPY
jgi:hypothetical protein